MSSVPRLRRPLVVAALACALAAVSAPAAQAYRVLTLTGFSNPTSVAVSPDGAVVYVTNNSS
ncbi:MAG: YncE family protein, partial [Actinomycetota bacterium]